MKNIFYSLALMIFTLISCSREEIKLIESNNRPLSKALSTDEMQSLLRLKSSNRIDINEAKKQALSFIESDPDNIPLKGQSNDLRIYSSSTIWKIREVVLKDGTVANDSIPVYVFNLANNKTDSAGYVIASGDDRIETVLANSSSGKLNREVTNPGLGIFLSNTPGYIDRKIEESKQQNDSIYNSAIKKINDNLPDSIKQYATKGSYNIRIENYSVGNWYNNVVYTPTVQVKWDQGYPYNKNLDNISCSGSSFRPYTGCAATAVAQIMAFHKYPSSINGASFNWNEMSAYGDAWWVTSDAQNQIANLMKYIGQGVKMSYGCSGSGAYGTDANNWIRNWYNTDGVGDYNVNSIMNSLSQNRPIFTTGYAIEEVTKNGWWIFSYTTTSYKEGHAFVLDGFIRKQRPINYDISYYWFGRRIYTQHVSYNESNDYVRCNFGWGGSNDGYYSSGVFDTNSGPVLKSGSPYFFQYKLEIIPNIRPK